MQTQNKSDIVFKIQKGRPSALPEGLPLSNITGRLWYYLKAKSQSFSPFLSGRGDRI